MSFYSEHLPMILYTNNFLRDSHEPRIGDMAHKLFYKLCDKSHHNVMNHWTVTA